MNQLELNPVGMSQCALFDHLTIHVHSRFEHSLNVHFVAGGVADGVVVGVVGDVAVEFDLVAVQLHLIRYS